MNQRFFKLDWLFVVLVSGLAVSYQPLNAMGTERKSAAVIILAQADNSSQTLLSDLELLQEKIKPLQESIDKLNQDLIKVYNKKIDRKQVNFKISNTQLQEFKKTWESWKQKLEGNPTVKNSVNNFVTEVDKHLASMEQVLLPLNENIIQSKEQFGNRESIPQLKEYQKKLFGENANPNDIDGLFGSGTQGKIELSFKEDITGIQDNVKNIKGQNLAFSSTETTTPFSSTETTTPNTSNQVNNNSPTELESLKSQLKQKDEQIEDLKNQIQQLQTKNNVNQTEGEQQIVANTPNDIPTSEIDSSGNNNILVPFVLLLMILGIMLFAFRQFNFAKKTRRDLLKNKKRITENIDLKEAIQTDYSRENDEFEEKKYSYTSAPSYYPSEQYGIDKGGKSGNTATSLPVKPMGEQVSTLSKNQEVTIESNLDNIKTEKDLIALYNNNYKALLNEIVIVKATKKSIEDKRAGYDSTIIFTKSDSGNYLVTNIPLLEEPYYYCLLPKKNLIINEHNYEGIKYVFNCRNYQNKKSNKFVLTQAAIVYWDEEAGKFGLYELGELVFY